jgi:hypothetical protein
MIRMRSRAASECGPPPITAGPRGPQTRFVGFTRRWRNPFLFLFGRSRREDYLAQYVVRECRRGRRLSEVLEDAYVRNRSTPEQRARLLDRPDIVAALGATATERLAHSRGETAE